MIFHTKMPEEGCYLYDTRSSIVSLPKDKIAVISGLKEYIVVDTDDVLMVCPRSEEQNIKKFIDEVKFHNGDTMTADDVQKRGSHAKNPDRRQRRSGFDHFSPLPERFFIWLTKYLGKTPNCFWKHLAKYDAELNPVM